MALQKNRPRHPVRSPRLRFGLIPRAGANDSAQRALAALLLLAVVAVWGSTFVLVKEALRDASPLLFNLLRMLIATVALVLVNRRALRNISRPTLAGGALAGVLLGAGYQLQTWGLAHTTAIKSAMITGTVVILVPVLSAVPSLRSPGRRRPGWSTWLGASLAFAGLLLLTTPSGTSMRSLLGSVGLGDLLTLGCAVAFAAHLLALSRLSHRSAAEIATLQIGTATLLMLVMLPLGAPLVFHPTLRLLVSLLITGLVATAAAFTIQTWAQRHLPATTTAVVLTLEPVFALAFSMIFLAERLSSRSVAGALLVLTGITVTELLTFPRPAAAQPVITNFEQI